ncbi:unnamed protein product [Bursaphelenchus okinawaensis]|uniref:PHD-type domain-containing protein n=1 Tax=Bursaphelenchus okinawaensis TaxID=465554 RepID=A0A811LN73_9BILA|nr:unnamed protein product [Bursaphelenchus okinawaensis]CAG9125212.1 unnamed protein product [Bursaphelenchus okinawaensis]
MENKSEEVKKDSIESLETPESSQGLQKIVKSEVNEAGDSKVDVSQSNGESSQESSQKNEDSDVKIEVDDDQEDKVDVKDEEEDENEVSDEEQESEEEEDDAEEGNDVKMEPKEEDRVVTRLDPKFLYEDTSFSQLCSFFNTFGSALGLEYTISKLEELFTTEENGMCLEEMKDLHTALFKRLSYLKYAQKNRFPSCYKKFVETNIETEEFAAELQMNGFDDLTYSTKISILNTLCCAQFDFNFKFKEILHHTYHVFDMRWGPIGVDKNGVEFFYQEDKDFNIRVFSVDAGDFKADSWELRARTTKELYKLIHNLKSDDYDIKKDEESEDDEDKVLSGNALKNEEESQQGVEDLTIEIKESDREKVVFTTKLCTLVNKYWPAELLHNKRTLKDIKKQAKVGQKPPPKKAKVEVVEEEEEVEEEKEASEEKEEEEKEKSQEKKQSQEKEEENKEEELINMDELEDERRVLPRRSARNAAYSNMRQFTTPKKAKKEKKEEVKKEESEPEEEEEEDEFEDDEEELGSSDDEFQMGNKKKGKRKRGLNAPKKIKKPRLDEDGEPIKRRKSKPKPVVLEESSDEEEEQEQEKQRKKANEKTLCMKCNKATKPTVLLLCDECDDAWHTFCLTPKLKEVPAGDWFCPKCNHKNLVLRLSVCYVDVTEQINIRRIEDEKRRIQEENERRRMERALRREHVNHGIDLRNIVDSTLRVPEPEPESESEEEIDDGQRKSKRKALKQFGHTRKEKQTYHPPITVAAGRSRRQLHSVDYNFSAYEDQIHEAMDAIDEPSASSSSRGEEKNGLGRGKDMQNIIEADEKHREGSQEEDGENQQNGTAKPPRKVGKAPKKAKKLTQLDVDNMTESDTDEYNAEEDEEEEEEIPSEDEYVPEEVARSRRSGGRGRHRSDDEFIDDSDSDFEPGNKKKKGKAAARKSTGRKGRGKGRGRKKWSDSEEETEEEEEDFVSDSDSDSNARSKRKAPPPRKWGPKASSSESEEEVEVDDYDDTEEEDEEKTESGRPLRRAAKGVSKKLHDLEEVEKELDEEVGESDEEATPKTAENVVGKPRPRKIVSDDEEDPDEFKPDDEEEQEEEGEEEIEEELAKELEEKKRKKLEHDKEKAAERPTKKRQVVEEDDEFSDEDSNPPQAKPRSRKTVSKSPEKQKPDPKEKATENGSSKAKTSEESSARKRKVNQADGDEPAAKKSEQAKKDSPKKQRSPPKSPTKPSSRRGSLQNPQPPAAASVIKPIVQLAVPTVASALPPHLMQHQLPPGFMPPHSAPYGHLPSHIRPPPGVYLPPPHGNQYGEYYGGHPQYLPPTSGYPPPPHGYPHYPSIPGYGIQPTNENDVAQLQPLRPVESDSLSHVLGGAMNPDSL